MPKPVPTNLITGFLGVGKTTALVELLKHKPAKQRWGVIVNEYGEVGIDGAILEDDRDGSVEIQEVAGGCVCCTSAVHFQFALSQVLEHARPERLLIETTGVGHPAKLLEDLQAPAYANRIDLRATLGILSPSDFANPDMFRSEVFRDQIELADVLVMNKADRLEDAEQRRFLDWVDTLYPPKLYVAIVEQGRLDPEWLDLGADTSRKALFPEAHADHEHRDDVLLPLPAKDHPIRKESFGHGGRACGWIFSKAEIFEEDRLIPFLCSDANVLRLKGIFRTEEGWLVVNRAGKETVTSAMGTARDSRLEVFAMNLPEGGWVGYEQRLKECRIKVSKD